MKEVDSSILCIMMFPFNRKVVTLDQLSYYNPHAYRNTDNVLPAISKENPTPYVDIIPSVYKYSHLLGAYSEPQPEIPSIPKGIMCTLYTTQK